MPTPSTPSTASGDSSIRAALVQAYPSHLLTVDHACLSSLASILRIYTPSLTAEDLYYKTEAILLQDKLQEISAEVVDQLKSGLQREWETKAKSVNNHQSKSFVTPASKSRADLGSLFGKTPQTPKTDTRQSNVDSFSSSSTPATPLPSQPHIIETLNPHIPSKESNEDEDLMNLDEDVKPRFAAASGSRVALAIGTDPRTWNYRYMFERPGMKGQALDDGLEDMTKLILETYNLARDEVADPSVTSQENVYVVGRLAALLHRDEKTPKLSDGMIIESSRSIGSGSRTPLQFAKSVMMRGLSSKDGKETVMHTSSNGRQIGLFPGMIAGFKGRNGGGDTFVVEEVLMPPALSHAASNAGLMMDYQHSPSRLNGEALQIQVASGPFTNDGDLDFIPWHRLMDQVERQKPDVILLMGPFLSVHHASLLDPNLNELPQDIFRRHISRRLNRLCELKNQTTAILLPSTKDIVSPHAAWPQPMFDKATLGIHKRVKCLPNPCLFSINEVVLGATTADILRDLKSQELILNVAIDSQVKNLEGEKDRDGMARTIRHLFHQRHFYPLFPTTSDLPLDVTHSKLASFPSVTPDILLLPSVLTPFARIVDGTVVSNPGTCARGSTPGKGSFASFRIQPMNKSSLQDQASSEKGQLSHQIFERARVDVFRI
ncbi:hypothetical protein CBS101457_001722 [Exobasidium rhododendri]|nr:hypothetical protein CBS101457_001722 [Exobasidium rhododendri]